MLVSAGHDDYWNWYWYTYCGWVDPGHSWVHPHPKPGIALPYWLDRPAWSGQNLVFPNVSWWSVYYKETLTPQSVDYTYWKAFATGSPGGGGPTPPPGPGPTPEPAPDPVSPTSGNKSVYKDDDWDISFFALSNRMPSKYVSGTADDLTYQVRITSLYQKTNPPRVPTYDDVILDKVEFYVGDMTKPLADTIDPGSGNPPLVTIPALPAGSWPPRWLPSQRSVSFVPKGENGQPNPDGQAPDYLYFPRVRFSSTHFPDGAIIPVKAIVHFTLLHSDGRAGKPGVLETPTYALTAYNRGLALATKLYVKCGTGYLKQETPTETYYNWDSQRAIPSNATQPDHSDGTAAVDVLLRMNHSMVEAGSPTPVLLSGSQILADLKQATTFFAYTHGEPSGFLPSYGANGDATSSDILRAGSGIGSQVNTAVLQGRTVPPPSMVVMYACSLLSTGYNFAEAFGILDASGSTVPDRAVAGFPDVVNDQVYVAGSTDPGKPPKILENTYLSAHAKAFFATLLAGQTIDQALVAANKVCATAHSTCQDDTLSPMPMKIQGDHDARLMGVYTGIPGVTTFANQDLSLPGGGLIWEFVLPPLSPNVTAPNPSNPSGGTPPSGNS